MTLSICAITGGKPYAEQFLARFRELANTLGTEFVIAGDGERGMEMAQRFADTTLPVTVPGAMAEAVYAPLARACKGDWVLRLDDDESCSEAMNDWLVSREWERGTETVYSFPYAWLWGDENHFLVSPPFWVDPHARLTSREYLTQWQVRVHGAGPGTGGTIVPVAHCHHGLLVKSLVERQEIALRYDALKPGAGTGHHFGKFLTPERFFPDGVLVRELGRGDVQLQEWVGQGEHVQIRLDNAVRGNMAETPEIPVQRTRPRNRDRVL